MVGRDFHLKMKCVFCHQGNEKKETKESAHAGLVKRPSDDPAKCGICHEATAQKYSKALHFTSLGQHEGVKPRFAAHEFKTFDEKIFQQSCRSCHASCGSCHVKSPPVGGITTGLLKGHQFVKKNESKTCAVCHGGRVYPEFTGEYGGAPDVHYQKGMMCADCHKKREMHGDGTLYKSKNEVKDRPQCLNCHTKRKDQVAHDIHKNKVSCYGCHASSQYRQCSSCHLETGSKDNPDFILGMNPRDKKTLTTLRLIPTIRNTFIKNGIKMENFDALPNYWDTPVHNIRKRTNRTRSCNSCHENREGFLQKETLIKDGSKANEGLIYNLKQINK